MTRTICPLLFMLLCTAALAAPPDLKINGPTKAVPGDIIILDASASVADHFDWAVDASGVAVPVSEGTEQLEKLAEAIRAAGGSVEFPETDAKPTHLILDGGKRALFASYSGTLRINLAGGNAEGVRQLPWVIVISGQGPQPPPVPPVPPVPPPTPNVEPDLPPGKYGLAIKSWRAAMQVTSAKRTEESGWIGTLLLMAATETTAQGMKDKFEDSLNEALDDAQWAAWQPWITFFGAEVNRLQLTKPEDVAVAFAELSVGLLSME